MNPKKSKEKERRRARKLAEQAWEAANEQNLDLAEKIIRRAVATQIENPVLWNDQGMLLALRGKEIDAEEAFRSAISLAPDYAEPFAHLGALRAKQGYWRDAVRLMERAVEHAPANVPYAERLQAYRALADTQKDPPLPAAAPVHVETIPEDGPLRQAVAALDWDAIGQRLTAEGCVRIPRLLPSDACAALSTMFDVDALFAKTVVMDRDDYGRGTYRYFQAPIPSLVAELRRAVYPHAARIANHWQKLLNEGDRFPAEWEGFREQCQTAGQTTPTPILLRYETHGFNALHRDLRGAVYFPIQMAVVLSPQRDAANQDGFQGGEFLLCDVPVSKKSKRREVAAGQGDGLLFCTRDRLARVGGAYGLLPVKHGVNPITAGTRVVLGVPFHEYR